MTLAAPVPLAGNGRVGRVPTGKGTAQRLFGLVREIRAEVQNMARSLDGVDAALTLQAAESRSAELGAAIGALNAILHENRSSVDARFVDLRELLDSAPVLSDAASDEVVTLENLWHRLLGSLDWEPETAESTVRAGLTAARGYVHEIEWHAGLITVPPRVKQHLAGLRVGNKLRFDATFADELSDPVQRRQMLAYLRDHPVFADGVVDVEHGLILRASPALRRRLVSYVGLPLFAILGGVTYLYVITRGIPLVGLSFSDVTGLGPTRFGDLLSAYVLLAAGQIAHIVVEAVKQQQRGEDSFRAIDDWMLWIHVREMSILVSILALWLTLFGLAEAFPNGINGVTAFTAGYSIDSILGVFITRFDARSAGATIDLAALLKGA